MHSTLLKRVPALLTWPGTGLQMAANTLTGPPLVVDSPRTNLGLATIHWSMGMGVLGAALWPPPIRARSSTSRATSGLIEVMEGSFRRPSRLHRSIQGSRPRDPAG